MVSVILESFQIVRRAAFSGNGRLRLDCQYKKVSHNFCFQKILFFRWLFFFFFYSLTLHYDK